MITTSASKSAFRLISALLAITAGAMLYTPVTHAIFGMDIVKSRYGHIMARGVVLTEDGYPTYVEYDESGEEVNEIAEASGFYEEATVMSAARYQQIVENYRYVLAEHGETIARGAFILSEEAFEGYSFVTRKNEPVTGTGKLMDATLSVLVRHKDEILIPDIDPILLQAPIDLNDAQDLDENTKSVLLSEQGKVLATSEHNIGFRVGFYKDEDESRLRAHEHDRIYQGLEDIPFETHSGNINGYAVSDERGFWKTEFLLSPCPGFSYEANVSTHARLRYRRYNPRGSRHGSFYMEKTSSHWCFGFGALLAATPNLSAQMTAVNMMAIQAAQAVFISPMDFYVDSAVISGQGELTNPAADGQGEDETVEVSGEPTSYHYEAPEDERILQENFDFDGDDKPDRTEFVEKEMVTIEDPETGQPTQVERYKKTEEKTRLQGVYFSSGGQDPDLPITEDRSQPDLIRLSDYKFDDRHQGLLANMNEEDLRETDLFVFRESNGMLVTYQKGLSDEDLLLYRDSGVDESQIYYQFLIRGPKTVNRRAGLNFSAFQSQAQINPELHEREADHLRADEPIRVIAINRKSGYIGSVQAKFMDFDQNGLISIPVDKLKMRPPNLKVKAERKYTVEAGMTNDKEREYLIGFEGGATTNDTIITITTEWLEHDGSPLPEGLGEYGYTGRLAKISGENTLSPDGGQVANFSIKPGRQQQLVRLKGDYAASEHLYVQINGEPMSENPDFANGGAAEAGPLQYRPQHYVPFLVALENEDASIRQYNAYRALKRDENVDQSTLYKPEPVFEWWYRPEMQFSVYDLQMKHIYRQANEDDAEVIDILPEEKPTIASSDDIIRLAYDMVEQQFEALPYLGLGKELVFAFGEEEIAATLDENANVVFTNLEHFAALDPEDFLSIRLYSNNDPGNVLWEYAFEYLYIEPADIGYPGETENTWYISADEPSVKLKAGVVGYAYREAADKPPINLSWRATGLGSFDRPEQTNSDTGLFDVEFTMPPRKGEKADISVFLRDSGVEAEWKTIEVLAGKPHRLVVTKAGQAIAMGQGEVRLNVTVYDRNNNLVEDGTGVDYDFGDSFIIVDQSLGTIDGRAHIILTGGEFAVDNSEVFIKSGEITATENLSIEGLSVSITADSNSLNKGQTVSLQAQVTTLSGSPVVEVPLSFSATRGLFSEQELLTDGAGIATTTFTAGLNENSGTWYAQVGFAGASSQDYEIVNSSPQSINARESMLVADESDDGVLEVEQYGVTTSLEYKTEAVISVRSDSSATVTLGDLADPNLEPLIALSMNEIISRDGRWWVDDEHGINPGKVDNISVVYDHPLGAGRSMHFESDSRVRLDSSATINMAFDRGFRLDLKPMENGQIVNFHNGVLQLSYQSEQLRLSIVTTDGSTTITAPNVQANRWHRIAAKFEADLLTLYVNGQLYTKSVTGTIPSSYSTGIELGGLKARMRAFRIYDFNSAPLIAFDSNLFASSITAGEHILTVKSLGNMGRLISNSQLKTLRVMVGIGNQRNYVSLLTKRGFQQLAFKYLTSAAPQDPFSSAYINNPLSGLVPTAHAWSWGGLWDGLKEAISYIIPYEDFIMIGEQLVYLAKQDWENFDATKLAFASLGAATIIPLAKPLKPLLGPLKKVVDGMRRFPAAKHFAGAIGSAAKAAVTGKTEKLANILPFVVIAIDLYEDQEVFEFIMNAIESEDDLWTWIDVIADIVAEAGGLGFSSVRDQNALNRQYAANPLEFLIPTAHALTGRQRAVRKILDNVKKYSRALPANQAKKVTKVWKTIKNNPTLRKILFKSGTMVKYFAIVGGNKIRSFVRNSKNWRVNRWFALFSVIYLLEEYEADRLSIGDERKLLTLVGKMFSSQKREYNGALFHASQAAYFQAMNQLGVGPRILGIEQTRPGYTLIEGERSGRPYNRHVDIILESGSNGEEWVEVKSYGKSSFSPSTFKNTPYKNGKKNPIYREFFHDLRLNKNFINAGNRSQILSSPNPDFPSANQPNELYSWYFHKWSGTRNGVPPTSAEERKARDWLCAKPNIQHIKKFYEEHFANSSAVTKTQCNSTSGARINLRDTENYLTEVVQRLVNEKGLDAQDFIDAVGNITDPNWN